MEFIVVDTSGSWLQVIWVLESRRLPLTVVIRSDWDVYFNKLKKHKGVDSFFLPFWPHGDREFREHERAKFCERWCPWKLHTLFVGPSRLVSIPGESSLMDDQKTSVKKEEGKWQNKYISDNDKLKITNNTCTTIASQNKDAPTIHLLWQLREPEKSQWREELTRPTTSSYFRRPWSKACKVALNQETSCFPILRHLT